MTTKNKESALPQAINLDDRVIFKISRNPDDLLNVVFYDTCGLPLYTFKDVKVNEIDDVVFGFRPKCEKIQILAYPNEEWFKDGCPDSPIARKFN